MILNCKDCASKVCIEAGVDRKPLIGAVCFIDKNTPNANDIIPVPYQQRRSRAKRYGYAKPSHGIFRG